MLRKSILTLVVVLVCGMAFAPPARAQSQTLTFNVGYLWVKGMSGRFDSGKTYPGDILWTEFNGANGEATVAGTSDYYNALDFNLKDFNNVTFGGDWTIAVNPFLDAGVGVSYYSRSVGSRSLNMVWGPPIDATSPPEGSDIFQTLRLRTIPISGTIRFLPLGRHAAIEPYIGGGVSFINYKYTEEGDFVDSTNAPDVSIFNVSCSASPSTCYEHSGWAVSPLVVGGVRFPVGAFLVGAEFKYQWGRGSLPTSGDTAFLSDHIDLGATTFQATFGYRF